MRIHRLRVNHLHNPLGYKLRKPIFSWCVEDAEGTKAEAARIRVTCDGAPVADTGWTPPKKTCEYVLAPVLSVKQVNPVPSSRRFKKKSVPSSGDVKLHVPVICRVPDSVPNVAQDKINRLDSNTC